MRPDNIRINALLVWAALSMASCATQSVEKNRYDSSVRLIREHKCDDAVTGLQQVYAGRDQAASSSAALRLGELYQDGCVSSDGTRIQRDKDIARMWYHRSSDPAASVWEARMDGTYVATTEPDNPPVPQGNPFQAANDVYAANLAAIQVRQNQLNSTSSAVAQPTSSNATQSSVGAGFHYEEGLGRCITLVRNPPGSGWSYAFQNSCNTAVSVRFFSPQTGPGLNEIDVAAGGRSDIAKWWEPGMNADFAVCRLGDATVALDGMTSWNTPNTKGVTSINGKNSTLSP